MPAIRRTRQPLAGAMLALVAVAAAFAVLAGAPARAADSAGPDYVKYYIVAASYQGKPENLAEIAGRFLGSTARSQEIFQLNVGVPQPGGGTLSNPAVLDPGWVLVLPWDAAGPGVRYGLPPPVPTSPSQSTSQAMSPPAPRRTAPVTAPDSGAACAATPRDTGSSLGDWGMLRVAPQQAWGYSRGAGVMVAVIDSGVDAGVSQLADRVRTGEDIIDGTGRGDTDCLGSGTAMAGIIAASSGTAGAAGVAPDATIMPVRVAPTRTAVSPADQAAAITAAVSAGARVIALGSYIDPALAPVTAAIRAASGQDVVIAAAAPPPSPGAATSYATVAATPGMIWAGAVNIDGAPAASYQPGMVDVVAPGAGLTAVGITGAGQFNASGTQYAAAFVAGEAALVRARYPDLTAAQVVHQIETTADQIGTTAPSAIFGWGLIDPGTAVTRAVADHTRIPSPPAATPPGHPWTTPRTTALAVTALLALILLLLLTLRARAMVRQTALTTPAPTTAPASAAASGPPGGTGVAAAPPTPAPATPACTPARATVPATTHQDTAASSALNTPLPPITATTPGRTATPTPAQPPTAAPPSP